MEPTTSTTISVEVNGESFEREVDARRLLVHFLRDDLDLTGTHIGCDTGNCGACSVIVDGELVKSCMMLAVQADGARIETVEGLAQDGELTPLQQAFSDHHGLQCGYCTPGMLMSATYLLRNNPEPTEHEIRKGIQGNICRCTGYVNIVEAIKAAAPGGGDMTETVTQEAPLVVEEGQEQRGFIGTNVPRKEDKRLVQGQGVFFDDVKRHGMGFVHFVRSPYAHARIVSVDVSKALELEGVYGTLTGDEVAILTDPFFELSTPPGAHIKDYALAVGRARFVGEPVAAVVAATRELARDASELIEVEYDPLPVLVDGEQALADDAVVMHEDAGSNVVWQGVFDWGDIDAAIAEADHVVKIDRLHFDRFSSTPLECSGCLTEYNRGTQQWTFYGNHQMPGVGAIWMAPALRVGIDKLRFVSQDIGGAFGNKICLHPYYVACALLARKLNRPVQWTEWRTDQHMANAHGNERTFREIEVPVKADGTMLGFKVRAIDDCGAFPRYEPLGCIIWAQVTPGCYRWRNIRVDFVQACTNKAPVSPNRGYSRMQHLWLTERIIDIVATELGLDPVEVRKKNYVRADEFPYTTPNGCVYDSGDYALCLDKALELIDYGSIEERRRDAESRGKLLGVGIGSTLDSGTNNFGQSQLLNPDLQFSGNNEVATVKLDIFGEIVVTLGTVPQGQGHETTTAQVVADLLGCTPDDVNVRPGHDSFFNSHAGLSGTYASQFAVTGLGAVKGACEKLAVEMKTLASAVLGAGVDDIELAEGHARLRDNPDVALPFMALGAILNANNAGLPEDMDISLNVRHMYRPYFEVPDKERKYGNLTLTYATQVHAAVVEIDPDTGVYDIVGYGAVDDCGNRIHPQIVEGQVHGATAHALGAATFESFTYDEDGNLLTPNFYDYHVPHALDMPPMRNGYIESPSPFTPFGAKGMGEGGGAGIHAVCAAIQDALRPAGRPVVTISCNPYHRVWELLQDPGRSRAGVEVESR